MKDIEEGFAEKFAELTNFKKNRFHPLVWINGEPEIGENVYIGGMSEINANGAKVVIGDNCDIASFVSINCADSHKKAIGISDNIERKDIIFENDIFVGSHCVIKGGAYIGHNTVIAAGTIVEGVTIPPYSLVVGNPMQIKSRYYKKKRQSTIAHNKLSFDIEEEQAAVKIIRSGWIAQGKEVEAFENEICDFLDLPHGHAVAVSSGTAALFLALLAVDAKNKKVAFPAYVCSSLRHATAMAQACELLIDSQRYSPNIDIEKLNLSNADIAIVPHMFGIPVDISQVSKKITVIEDCAQALGAKINGTPVGLQGDVGVFSFYATKMITAAGQGGMLVSKNRDLIDAIRDYREFDQRNDEAKRFNFQMTDLQAAIGRVQLKKLPSFIARREEIFKQYKQAGLNMLNFENGVPVRYRAILIDSRASKILENLTQLGVKSIVPLEEWELLGKKELFPEAFAWTQRTVSLPIYPSLTDKEVKKIIMGVTTA